MKDSMIVKCTCGWVGYLKDAKASTVYNGVVGVIQYKCPKCGKVITGA